MARMTILPKLLARRERRTVSNVSVDPAFVPALLAASARARDFTVKGRLENICRPIQNFLFRSINARSPHTDAVCRQFRQDYHHNHTSIISLASSPLTLERVADLRHLGANPRSLARLGARAGGARATTDRSRPRQPNC